MIEAIFGALLGAIFTYFFENRKKKTVNREIYEEQYVKEVCAPIIKYLKGSNISRQATFEYIEKVFADNLICINKSDEELINGLRNSSGKSDFELYTELQSHFLCSINRYKDRMDSKHFKQERDYSKVIKAIIIIAGIIGCLTLFIGIAGASGIYAWGLSLYNWDNSLIFSREVFFVNTIEVVTFIVIGIVLLVVSIFFYWKFAEKLSKK